MSELLHKYKNSFPRPRGINYTQIAKNITACQKRRKKQNILALMFLLAAIITCFNIISYRRSFDRCTEYLKEIHASAARIEQDLATMRGYVK